MKSKRTRTGCSGLSRLDCRGRKRRCIWWKYRCRCKNPCLSQSQPQPCKQVDGCQWRRWNSRAREDACYPIRAGIQHRFLIVGSSYCCTLHPVRCCVCGVRTVLRPLCAPHAREHLGVEVKRTRFPDGTMGGGLFATQDFEKGDLICPYLGRIYRNGDWRCPRSTGDTDEGGSAYNLELDANFGVDASCHRSYGAMANHAKAPMRNGLYVFVRGLCTGSVIQERPWRRTVLLGVTIRAGTLGNRRTAPAYVTEEDGFWIQAQRRIPAGSEVLVDYGSCASDILRMRTRTEPPVV